MPDFSKAVNAALTGCNDWLERPALIVNRIKDLVGLKIVGLKINGRNLPKVADCGIKTK